MIHIQYKIIILIIIIILLLINYLSIKYKIETFTNSKNKNIYNTEIHFITFWDTNNIHKDRVKQKIEELNNQKIDDFKNSKIRIIKELKINKLNIKSLFKNVGSGGKHSKHDIDIFIIEVPNIYKIHSTHDHPNGEKVNDIMFKLKTTARGTYTNFKNFERFYYELRVLKENPSQKFKRVMIDYVPFANIFIKNKYNFYFD